MQNCHDAKARSIVWLTVGLLMLRCASAYCEIIAVEGVEMVARLTGPGAINDTGAVGIGGTDLGHMVNHAGRTYFLFGDTFSGDTPGAGGCWRWNTMAYSTDTDPADGIHFDGWITGDQVCGHTGWARQMIDSEMPEPPRITEIPTGAVSLSDRIHTWFVSVNWWGTAPQEWTANYGGLAHWGVGEPSFTVVHDFQFPGKGNFCAVAANFRTDLPPGQDDHLYIWGTPAGRLGGVKLARAHPDTVTDLGTYRYFGGLDEDGLPTWIADEFTAPLIVDPPVGEVSVMFNPAAGAWTLLYLNHGDERVIELREAPEPWGPWSPPITVTTGLDFPGRLYGSFMNPLYVESGGRTFYFTITLGEPYDVYLLRANLELTTPVAVPAASVWGTVAMAQLLLAAGTIGLARQRRGYRQHVGHRRT